MSSIMRRRRGLISAIGKPPVSGVGLRKPTILSDRRQLLRPPLNCRASGFVQSLDLLARDVLPEFAERAAERDQRKADELAPHVEKALARKKSMAPLADADIPGG